MSSEEKRNGRAAAALVAIVVLLVALSWLLYERGHEQDEREPAGGAARLVLAHIVDPRAGSDSNNADLMRALRALRGQPDAPLPAIIVVSGEMTSPAEPSVPSPPSAPIHAPTTAGASGSMTPVTSSAPNAATDDATSRKPNSATNPAMARGLAAGQSTRVRSGYAILGGALGASPVGTVFLFAGGITPIPAESLAELRAPLDSAGVKAYDLQPCSRTAVRSIAPCDVGSRFRLLALPAFPPVDSAANQLIVAADSFVSHAERDGRRVILVASGLPSTDSASVKVRDAWVNLVDRDGVAAVLVSSLEGTVGPPRKLVRTPSLGRLGTEASSMTRGLVVATIGGAAPVVDTLLRDRDYRRTAAPAFLTRGEEERGTIERLFALGNSIGEPAHSAIFWIALFMAFLTVATLWKVPGPDDDADRSAGASTDSAAATVAGGTPAGTPTTSPGTGSITTDDGTDVFKSNLARTAISGLTGIATIAILKDYWNVPGVTGQGFFVVVFISTFFAFLLMTAFARALIEALRERVAVGITHADVHGGGEWWRRELTRFRAWLSSYRTTILLFVETFASIMFGRAPRPLWVWARRYATTQRGLLATVDRMREEVSANVGRALERAGVRQDGANPTHRVNVSLLHPNGKETYYISAASGSLSSIFGSASVAYVAIRSGQTRWWKFWYRGDHHLVRSACRLRAPGDAVPTGSAAASTLEVVDGVTRSPLGNATTITGTRCDGSSFTLQYSPDTVGRLLALLNSADALSGGTRPAVASLDADGALVIAELGVPDPKSPPTPSVKIGNTMFGAFKAVERDADIVLLDDATELIPGVTGPLKLKDYFDERPPLDYDAFIVIPVPFTLRGTSGVRRRAGIHISFRRAAHLDVLWYGLDRMNTQAKLAPDYSKYQDVLGPSMLADETLAAVLKGAVRVLGEAIQPINDRWYRSQRDVLR